MKMKVSGKKKEAVTVGEVAELIKALIDLVDKRFNLMDNKLGAIEIGLTQKISGLGNRIDDLALNRVKYSDFDVLRKEVEMLQARVLVGSQRKK